MHNKKRDEDFALSFWFLSESAAFLNMCMVLVLFRSKRCVVFNLFHLSMTFLWILIFVCLRQCFFFIPFAHFFCNVLSFSHFLICNVWLLHWLFFAPQTVESYRGMTV